MDIVLKSRKGFSMLEMLVCMCIISAMISLSLLNVNNTDFDYYYFLNDYLYTQIEAMNKREDVDFKNGIYFNNMGHVNQAKTVDFNNHSVVIHIGNGYATIK